MDAFPAAFSLCCEDPEIIPSIDPFTIAESRAKGFIRLLKQFRDSLPLIWTDFCLPVLHTFAFAHLITMGTKITLHGLDRTNVFDVTRDMGDLLSTQAIRDSISHKVLKVSMAICIHADILAQESNVYL